MKPGSGVAGCTIWRRCSGLVQHQLLRVLLLGGVQMATCSLKIQSWSGRRQGDRSRALTKGLGCQSVGAIGRCTISAASTIVPAWSGSLGSEWRQQRRPSMVFAASPPSRRFRSSNGHLAAQHRDRSPADPCAQSSADASRQWANALVACLQLGGAPPPFAVGVDETAWRTSPPLQGFAGVVESCGVALLGANAVGPVAIRSGWSGVVGGDAGDLGWRRVFAPALGGASTGC